MMHGTINIQCVTNQLENLHMGLKEEVNPVKNKGCAQAFPRFLSEYKHVCESCFTSVS